MSYNVISTLYYSEQASKPQSKRILPFFSWWEAKGQLPDSLFRSVVDEPAASPGKLIRNAKSQAPLKTSWIKICLFINSYVIPVHVKVWKALPSTFSFSFSFQLSFSDFVQTVFTFWRFSFGFPSESVNPYSRKEWHSLTPVILNSIRITWGAFKSTDTWVLPLEIPIQLLKEMWALVF